MEEILVVTGLPRSGTSLMMQLIHKANIPILSDGKREKDISNPEGYYELEAVKGIVSDNSFLQGAPGKAVKIVAPLPLYLDIEFKYKVIFMRREMDEILRSQEKMLQKDQVSEREKFRTIYEFHLKKTYKFLLENEIPFIDINYNKLLTNPENELDRFKQFLNVNSSIQELLEVVRPDLYRNRNEK